MTSTTATASVASVSQQSSRKHQSKPSGWEASCCVRGGSGRSAVGSAVKGPALAVLGVTCAACLLLLVGVGTTAWDSVTFDLVLANRTLAASTSRRLLYADAARSQLAGLIILPTPANSSGGVTVAAGSASSGGYCLLNVYASLWSLCDSVYRADSASNQDYNTYCSKYSLLIRNNTCFSYIYNYNEVRDVLDNTENTSESQIMKMQNNAMACCIVVLLCVLASIVTGAIGILARVVPAVTVTGVLHLTAGIFIIFSNSIEHEKTSRMMRKPQIDVCPQCACYSLVKTPEQFCNAAYRTVSIGWSVVVTWMAAASFMVTTVSWVLLARRLRIDKSKAMV